MAYGVGVCLEARWTPLQTSIMIIPATLNLQKVNSFHIQRIQTTVTGTLMLGINLQLLILPILLVNSLKFMTKTFGLADHYKNMIQLGTWKYNVLLNVLIIVVMMENVQRKYNVLLNVLIIVGMMENVQRKYNVLLNVLIIVVMMANVQRKYNVLLNVLIIVGMMENVQRKIIILIYQKI